MAALYAPRWGLSSPDEVWAQMTSYYQAAGQLDRETVAAWAGDEVGFFELGTMASYGQEWEQGPVSGDAAWVGSWGTPGSWL